MLLAIKTYFLLSQFCLFKKIEKKKSRVYTLLWTTTFCFRNVTITIHKLYTKTESDYDDDDDDDIVPAGDKFSSDEDSDSCRGSRKISNTSIDSDSGRDSRISYNSTKFSYNSIDSFQDHVPVLE